MGRFAIIKKASAMLEKLRQIFKKVFRVLTASFMAVVVVGALYWAWITFEDQLKSEANHKQHALMLKETRMKITQETREELEKRMASGQTHYEPPRTALT
jgi:hypothetical protein